MTQEINTAIKEAISNYSKGNTENFSNKQFIQWLTAQQKQIEDQAAEHKEIMGEWLSERMELLNRINELYTANKDQAKEIERLTQLLKENE